jgi:uncharacterized membrane protein
MKEIDVLSEVAIRRPRNEVAAYAVDPDHVPSWYANIQSVEWKTPPPIALGSRIAFVAKFAGRRLEYTYEVVELYPGKRFVMRTAEGPFPMETTYTWEAIDRDTTRMTLRNRGLPSGFSALMRPFMSWMLARENRKDLALLKRVLEAQGQRAEEP